MGAWFGEGQAVVEVKPGTVISMKGVKGTGNFRNLFLYSPGGN